MGVGTNEWLIEEYKLIQSKIDKFGEDRFKVRSWCVTLVSGLIVGTKFTTLSLSFVLIFALLAVFLFHLVEHQQRSTSRRLGWRAREIERAIAESDNSDLRKKLQFVPGIADTLIRTSNFERRAKFPWPWKTLDYEASEGKFLNRLSAFWQWCVPRADDLFYIGQYIVLAIALFYSACGGSLLKDARQADEKQNVSFNATNIFSFSFQATNLIATNYVIKNVVVTNFAVTNIVIASRTLSNKTAVPTNK
jgi:hypothetical protein